MTEPWMTEPEGVPTRRLVCLHGAGGTPADFGSWRGVFQGWVVISPDLQRGVTDLGRASMDDYAAEAATALARTSDAVVCGWSMGGLVALMVAVRHRVAGLVLLEPSLPDDVAVGPLDCPMLVIGAAEFTESRARPLAAHYGADLACFPDLDHVALLHSREVLDRVARWLAALPV